MKGYRIMFFTQEGRKVHGRSIAEWILEKAREVGAAGGTMMAGGEGFGHQGTFHSAGFLEMTDRPVTLSVVTDEASCQALMAAVNEAAIDVFYCRHEVEFGRLGR
ncbi:DUF190 domain-containing protein [Dyella sp.]|uniref:DUF190 domain-containing protein n=1 Tax=Dyella sp. TaxID=1869338 RepID=UPI002ED14342